MPQLLEAIDDSIVVEYGQFLVQESGMLRPAGVLPVPRGPWVAVGGPGGLLLHSAATDHHPAVRLELWDEEPPADGGAWDSVLDLACELDSGVRLLSIMAAMTPMVLPLPRPGSYHARVHSGDREEAGRLDEATFARAVERWLIQFWPA
ncbi:hypothetical protein ACIA5G_28825 [Amycolatopsis sp. NPDC051758]|uniref:hypothetical protein n=1 Tax=Amycolatopsis sp. NPDC051758 TaxID=3363935 RepID=UPI0037BCF6F4